MSNLFKGLENFGFKDLHEFKIFEKKKKEDLDNTSVQQPIKIEDLLYIKTFKCPICKNDFHERIVRKSKLKLLSQDFDLKCNYELINPIIFDVILCPHCGYSAIKQFFNNIFGKKIELIQEKITPNFIPKEYPFVLSIDDGIERYKLALYNALAKNAKSSEKAFICMRIAWLYRDKKDKENEKLFLENACIGFVDAYSNEDMPICDMNELTITYLIACFYKVTENLTEAMRWISLLVVSRQANNRIKQRALDLKDEIRKELELLEQNTNISKCK